jgi:hypothetical protein
MPSLFLTNEEVEALNNNFLESNLIKENSKDYLVLRTIRLKLLKIHFKIKIKKPQKRIKKQ